MAERRKNSDLEQNTSKTESPNSKAADTSNEGSSDSVLDASAGECSNHENKMTRFDVPLLGFIGAGQLARILMKGFISAGLFGANDIIASDINPEILKLSEAMEVNTTSCNTQVVNSCNVVIIAVEPQVMPEVLKEIRNDVTKGHLIISVAAGVTIRTITEYLIPAIPETDHNDSPTNATATSIVQENDSEDSEKARVIRVMANTPTAVQQGVTVYSVGDFCTERDQELAKVLFSSVGMCEQMGEQYMDAVTGVSGSGPAYAFTAIEALSDGGVKMGLPRELAIKFAAQTLLGAAKMVLETGEHPAQLKDSVTSPGGTTIAALHELEKAGFRAALINAVQTAATKSKELNASEK